MSYAGRNRVFVDGDRGHDDGVPGELHEFFARLDGRLDRIEQGLADLNRVVSPRQVVKDYYTTAEAATVLGKRPFTVREWCRLGRVHAKKTHAGHGIDAEWRISHDELRRIQNEGLLPVPLRY